MQSTHNPPSRYARGASREPRTPRAWRGAGQAGRPCPREPGRAARAKGGGFPRESPGVGAAYGDPATLAARGGVNESLDPPLPGRYGGGE